MRNNFNQGKLDPRIFFKYGSQTDHLLRSFLLFYTTRTFEFLISFSTSAKSNNRDHGKENHKKIKEIQRANKERQQVAETSRQTPMKAVYKPDKFDHVQSKVAQRLKVKRFC